MIHAGDLSLDPSKIVAIEPKSNGLLVHVEGLSVSISIQTGTAEYEGLQQWREKDQDRQKQDLLQKSPDVAQDALFYFQCLLERSGNSLQNTGVDGLPKTIRDLALLVAVEKGWTVEQVIENYSPSDKS